MSIERAIARLEAEVEQSGVLRPGSDRLPAGSTEWYIARAKAIGMSALRQIAQEGIGDNAVAAEKRMKLLIRGNKQPEEKRVLLADDAKADR